MKRVIFTACIAFVSMSLSAQQTANDYIVKTKNAKKLAAASEMVVDGTVPATDLPTVRDFISANFHFSSLCEWEDGMKFMVMPEKYDMVVKTFHDPTQGGREVSSMTLRHKILVYKGHTESADGHAHINFFCPELNKDYYYEVPTGSFEDYCYGKMGVPTLAYLGDVDIAREKLIGKRLFTKTDMYCIDTDYDGDGYQEVKLDKNQEVTVTAVGVGTRRFPVKIIFEDDRGNEYFQNVAISKTNSGMRDDEFIGGDYARFLFGGSFEIEDDIMAVSKDISQYIGKTVHTKYTTSMVTRGDGKDRTLNVPRMTSFVIENLIPKRDGTYVTLTLKAVESSRIYFKDVTFVNIDNVAGDIDGKREDYFGYLFAMGEGKTSNTSQAARAAIREGRVIVGMTADEVLLAMGEEPFKKVINDNGKEDWLYNRSKGVLTIHFALNGLVEKYTTPGDAAKKKTTSRSSSRRTSKSSAKRK